MRRGRVAIAGVALLALIVGTTNTAEAKPVPIQQRAANQQVHYGADKFLTDYRPNVGGDRTITAIVELKGDNLLDLKAAAEARKAKFDEPAAKKALQARQDAVAKTFVGAGAKVIGRYVRVLNAVKVTMKMSKITALTKLPGVNAVYVSRKISRPDNANSNAYTGVPAAWDDTGLTGLGVKVAVIDTGTDYYHEDFNGLGAAAFAADNGLAAYPNFPTGKVVAGWDFVGDDYDADIPVPDSDPLDCNGHGTHVSGTAAGMGVLDDGSTYTGPYDSSLNPADFRVFPGSAPEASLMAYRVFGCDGSANDDVIIDAIEMAVADGADVINMSLGSEWGDGKGLSEKAVDNASKAGVVMVISAGNAGSGAYLVGGPGTADRAISVAAVDGGYASYPGALAEDDANVLADVPLVSTNDVPIGAPISGLVLKLGLGCSESEYDPEAFGKIVVATRGTCDRVDRAKFGAAHGALAVILINNSAAFPPFEGPITGVGIPFLGAASGAVFTNGEAITISSSGSVPNPSFGDSASFTSNGARNGDSSQKPDLSAPGVSVLSAAVGTGTEGAFNSGTSMASPHAAGIAALVVEAHPAWTAAQVKSAMMSTADSGLIGDFDSRRNGTGMVRADLAVDTKAYMSTSDFKNSLNFGFATLAGAYNVGRDFNITNTGATDITYNLTTDVTSLPYGSVSVTPSTVKVKAGWTVTVKVSIKLSLAQMQALPNMSPLGPGASSDFGDLVTLNGVVIATPQVPGPGVYPLSMAFMLVPKGLSDIDPKASTVKVTGGTTTLSLQNKGKHSGLVDIYAHALSDASNDLPPSSSAPNLLSVGVQTFYDGFDNQIYFGVNLSHPSSTQTTHEIIIWVDSDNNGFPDHLIDVADIGFFTTGAPIGVMGAATIRLADNVVTDLWGVSAPSNGTALSIPTYAGSLGLTYPSNGRFSFTVEGYSVVEDTPGDFIPGSGPFGAQWATFNTFFPVLETGQVYAYQPAGATWNIPAGVDVSQLANQTPRGWLIMNMDDLQGGKSAQVITIVGAIT